MPKANSLQAHPVQHFAEIASALNSVKCALTCASVALGQAQNTLDAQLAEKAWRAIDEGVANLDRVEADLDVWYAAHEHTPSAAVRNCA
jgi:hypothetical protein